MSTLIFNPEYKIINDYDRCIIIKSTNGGYDEYSNYFIHPFHALFFSLFDGKNDPLKTLESHYQMTSEGIERLVQMFTNNDFMFIKYDGEYFRIPQNILIQNNNGIIRTDLNNDYSCHEPYNFKRLRLVFPKSIVYVVNMKCYTNCIYCYANRKHPHNLMSTDKIVSIINESKKIGILDFTLTGGEFFLQKDWKIILKALLDNSYEPEISTKVPLTKDDIISVKNLGLKEIQYSLDTLDVEIAKKTLNVKDDYIEKITESIKFADEMGLKVTLKPTLCKYTCSKENLSDIINFANTLKNIKKITVSTTGKSIYIESDFYDKIRPSLKQVEEIVQFINQCNVSFEISPDINTTLKEELCNISSFKERTLCTGNIDGFIILPDGKVTICEELYWNPDFILGDLNNDTILDIWKSEKALNLWNICDKDIPAYSACKKCNDLNFCRQGLGVCWKFIIQTYGSDKVFNPDPRCPKAPEPLLNIIDK